MVVSGTSDEPDAVGVERAKPAATPGTPRLLRAINDRTALDLLLEAGPLSRGRIGALTGLSKPTASQLLARLESAGLVLQVGVQEGGPGPSAALYQVNPRAGHVGGLDVTQNRIVAAVANLTGQIVGEYELRTPGRSASGAADNVWRALAGAARAADLAVDELVHVVVGTPGAVDPNTRTLGYARHLPGWHSPDMPAVLRAALAGASGEGPGVDLENDVNLTALAEHATGVAVGCANFVQLWISDGVGMAIVLGGVLHRGATGGAGEVGYMPMPGTPLVRNIGRGTIGGFQAAAGGPAVLKLAREHGIASRDPAIAVRRATAGYLAAASTGRMLPALAERLATGLAAIVTVLDPELIVLTGDILLAGGEPLRELIGHQLHGMAIPRPRLALSTVPGNQVLAGAIHAALRVARDVVFGRSAAPGARP